MIQQCIPGTGISPRYDAYSAFHLSPTRYASSVMRVAVQMVPSNYQLHFPITSNFPNDNSPAPSHALSVKKTFKVIKEAHLTCL